MASQDSKSKGIRFPLWMIDEVEALAKRDHRDFSKQVVFMVEKYLPYCKQEEKERDASTQ